MPAARLRYEKPPRLTELRTNVTGCALSRTHMRHGANPGAFLYLRKRIFYYGVLALAACSSVH